MKQEGGLLRMRRASFETLLPPAFHAGPLSFQSTARRRVRARSIKRSSRGKLRAIDANGDAERDQLKDPHLRNLDRGLVMKRDRVSLRPTISRLA
jgi:hypothetical protein